MAALSSAVMHQVLSSCRFGGMCAVGLRNDLVAFQMEWSSADRLVMYDSKVVFRIDCRAVRGSCVSVLYTLLSIGLRLYCHLFRARRFSVTNALMYRGVGLPEGGPWSGDGVDAHAASWIRHVSHHRYHPGFKVGCLGVACRLCVRKMFQLVVCNDSLGAGGLQKTWVLSVAMIGVWSEDRSQFEVSCR